MITLKPSGRLGQTHTMLKPTQPQYNTEYALPPALLLVLYPCWIPCMDFKLPRDKNPECQTCRMSFPLSVTSGIWRSAPVFELLPSSRATGFFIFLWMHVCEELYLMS